MPSTEIAARLAAHRERVLASGRKREITRLAWGALMQLHHWLVYQPVWDAAPVVLGEWKARPVRVPELPELAALAPGLRILRAAGTIISAGQLAELVHEAVQALDTPVAERKYTAASASLPQWRRTVRIPRAELVEKFASLPIPGMRSLVLHGSLADGRIVNGYSDFDVMVVLRVPESSSEFAEQIEALLHANHLLIAQNPLMHHGPMVYFEGYLNDAAEAVLPSAALDHSVLLAGDPVEVHYGDGTAETLRVIDTFEGFFCTRFAGGAGEIRNAFDALWWISTALLLPSLEHQARTDRSAWKGDVLRTSTEPYVRRLSECRAALGEWVAARTASTSHWPQESNVNPGIGIRGWKDRLTLDRNIGIDAWLVEQVRTAVRRLAPTASPARITRYPRRGSKQEYEELRAHWLRIAEATGSVAAVYEFGSVGCPGLSDLDLLFVVRGGPESLRHLTINACTERQRQLMGHDPLLVAEGAMATLGNLLPLFTVRHLWGEQYELPMAEELPADVFACAITAYNFRKYPSDLDRIGGDLHSSLAYLHSFAHVARCLSILGVDVPANVARCLELDREIRSIFSATGGVHAGVMGPVMEAMRAASEETVVVLERWWRTRLGWTGEAPLLAWLCAYIADPETKPIFPHPFIDEALAVLAPYRQHKKAFLDAMRAAGMPIDGYLYDWRYRDDAALRRETFRFERELGGELRITLGTELFFGAEGSGVESLIDGWSTPEEWGVWADGSTARVAFQLEAGAIEVEGRSLVGRGRERQRVVIANGDDVVGEYEFDSNAPQKIVIPGLPAGPIILDIQCRDAASPEELGLSSDTRKLGFGLIKIRKSEAAGSKGPAGQPVA